ncbi:PREDICTED: uncharacterized protein LOC109236760 [Nicotiana attenuata]|nr:PREDICTED: uncharacterized protein LOC109236760 [Nicotiana attenuata]
MSSPIDCFERLPDSLVLRIFDTIGDAKALGICCVVCTRFRSLVPEAGFFVWQRELPRKYLDHEDLWNDDDFLPDPFFKEYRDEFRKIYSRYFRQIIQSHGFDIDVYPGNAKAAFYVPYLDFEREVDMLMELATYAIEEFNKTSVYKYKVIKIETVNFMLSRYREFFMTVKVENLTLRTPWATFRIRARKGFHGEKIVSFCRPKV